MKRLKSWQIAGERGLDCVSVPALPLYLADTEPLRRTSREHYPEAFDDAERY
jgi:hypothetical protein